MELTAKLVQILPLQSGTGRNGEWRKQEIIVETEGQYPKKVCISIWGDKIDNPALQIDNLLTVSFDVESREYNGRWYTDVKAWKVELASEGASASGMNTAPVAPPKAVDFSQGDAADDLPF